MKILKYLSLCVAILSLMLVTYIIAEPVCKIWIMPAMYNAVVAIDTSFEMFQIFRFALIIMVLTQITTIMLRKNRNEAVDGTKGDMFHAIITLVLVVTLWWGALHNALQPINTTTMSVSLQVMWMMECALLGVFSLILTVSYMNLAKHPRLVKTS